MPALIIKVEAKQDEEGKWYWHDARGIVLVPDDPEADVELLIPKEEAKQIEKEHPLDHRLYDKRMYDGDMHLFDKETGEPIWAQLSH